MTVYYNVEFAEGTVDLYNTNSNQINRVAANYKRIATWQLNDHTLTKKFIDLFLRRQRAFLDNNQSWYLNYNYYLPRNRENIAQAKREMNETIKWLATNVADIQLLDLKNLLNVDNLEDIELDKLNALHFMFEHNLPILEALGRPRKQILKVEKINSLVHFLEFGLSDNNFMNLVFRPNAHHDVPDIELAPEDYSSFEINRPGTLQLDFATVGKDLIAAWTTNDQDLVRNQEVKPQRFCTTTVGVEFAHDITVLRPEQRRGIPPKLREWIEENNLAEFIDLDNPMYCIGRHPLGVPVDPEMYSTDFWQQLLRTSPYVNRVYLSDDHGQIF